MLIAIHQPNFIPWFPFFEKMYRADIFVILTQCQFEKNGFQNRANVFNKWWTKPVQSGLEPINTKHYADGLPLLKVNLTWIYAIALTLGINIKKIVFDDKIESKGTQRLIDICKFYNCNEYLSNPAAAHKYLNLKMMEEANIKIVPFYPTVKKHIFEMFDEYGIEGTRKLMEKGKK